MKRLSRRFGRGVEANQRPWYHTDTARDSEDVAALLSPEQRQSCSQDADHPEVVRIEEILHLPVRSFFGRRDQAVPGVIHQYVEAAKVVVRLLNDLRNLRAVRYIQLQGQHQITVPSFQVGDVVQFAGSRRHLVAALQRSLSPDPAEAAGCSCDEPYFAAHEISPPPRQPRLRVSVHCKVMRRNRLFGTD